MLCAQLHKSKMLFSRVIQCFTWLQAPQRILKFFICRLWCHDMGVWRHDFSLNVYIKVLKCLLCSLCKWCSCVQCFFLDLGKLFPEVIRKPVKISLGIYSGCRTWISFSPGEKKLKTLQNGRVKKTRAHCILSSILFCPFSILSVQYILEIGTPIHYYRGFWVRFPAEASNCFSVVSVPALGLTQCPLQWVLYAVN